MYRSESVSRPAPRRFECTAKPSLGFVSMASNLGVFWKKMPEGGFEIDVALHDQDGRASKSSALPDEDE